jgi:hopanoid biosynthesis associated RND transporter like protein HpnN
MLNGAANLIEQLLVRCHDVAVRRAWWVTLLVLLALVPSYLYISENLRINTDQEGLLSDQLPWRKAFLNYKRAFPQYSDLMVVIIDGDTPDQAQDAGLLLGKRLRRETQLFENVFQPDVSEFFRKNGLLFFSVEELEDLADKLAEVQPFLARLNADPSARGLFSTMTEAVNELSKGETYELKRAFESFANTIEANAEGRRERLSWQGLMSGRKIEANDKRATIVVRPRLDFGKLLPGETAFHAIHDIAEELGLTPENGVRVRLTGGAALEYEEMLSVSKGSAIAGMMALGMVAVLLLIGYRSVWLVTATLLTLIVGIVFTGVMATLLVGRLNLISVGFAIFNIGLGGDYAIQYCLRYRELLGGHSQDHRPALLATGRYIAGSLVLCALTTAVGFFAFLPTSYVGVAELGVIAGSGMLVSVALSLTFLPALLSLIRIRAYVRPPPGRFMTWLASLPARNGRTVLLTTLALVVGSALLLPRLSFDPNPVHLQNPKAESVRTYKDLLADSDRSPLSIVMALPDQAAVEQFKAKLEALNTVEGVEWVNDFVAEDQEDKLPIIEDMAFLLGPELMDGVSKPTASTEEKLAALEGLVVALNGYLKQADLNTPLAQSAERLRGALTRMQARLNAAEPARRKSIIEALESDLIGGLAGRLDALSASLDATEFTVEDLPPDLLERWRSADRHYRVEVLPKENLDDNEALRRFVDEVRAVAPEQATGAPVMNLESGDSIITAFKQAFVYAMVVIVALLFVVMHKKIDIVFGLAPLLLAGLFTGAVCVIAGIPFNFANIITVPLFLSMGIDSGIHILHRFRSAPPADGLLLTTGTAKGVALSTMTSVLGFGNLAISPHWGTASMGVTLAIGNFLTLLCTFIVLPSLLGLLNRNPATPMRLLQDPSDEQNGLAPPQHHPAHAAQKQRSAASAQRARNVKGRRRR